MNNKHLAAILLFAVIIAFSQGVLLLSKKCKAAEEAAEAAEGQLRTAVTMRETAQGALQKTRRESAPLRRYYQMWLPDFQKTDSEVKAKNSFLETIKRVSNLVMFDQGMNPLAPRKEAVYVVQQASGRAKFEGDYQKSLQLLSSIERDLPTSRIASLEIRKGQRANDVEVSILVEFPVIAAPPEVKK